MMQVRFLSDAFMKKGKMKKKYTRDHLTIKETFHKAVSVISDYILLFKEWLTDYGKVFLPVTLLLLVAVTALVSLNARERVEAAAKEALEVLEESKTDVQEVKDVLFEEDTYPDINALIYRYYMSLEFADIDTLIDIQSMVTRTETIRLQKMSEYIDSYDNIHVYTKPGPYSDTFIAYAYSEVYLNGRDEFTPGLEAFYICKDENGEYYINSSELSDEEELYIRDVSKQSDVVDLKNSVNVSYSEIMETNEELSAYWAQISVDIDLAVGEALALDAVIQAQLDGDTDALKKQEDEEELEPSEPVIQRVRTTEKVNVRKSASATADRLGRAEGGETFVLLENMANGWSRISYQDGEGYIKSEFLVVVEDVDKLASTGTVTVNTDSLNVRSEPSQTSTRLGVLLDGEVVELIEYVNDGAWCKIKFKGQIGFVKAEYVK